MSRFLTKSADLQDEFAYRVIMTAHLLKNGNIDYKGTFLDVGAGHGHHHNNTIALERLGWTGELIEYNSELVALNNKIRSSPCYCLDARTDFSSVLKRQEYDYISFDVDDSTLEAVKAFPWDKIKFKVMTIEHDAYRVGDKPRELIRKKMKEQGYFCLAYDVLCCDGGAFEDWYVSPDLPALAYLKYFSVGKRAIEVLFVPK